MKIILKLAIGFLILGYMLRAHLIDFSALRNVVRSPWPVVISLALVALANALLAVRWYALLRAQSLPLRLSRILQVHWASAFLSLVLPGSVGTDVAKIWYVVGDAPERKGAAALTILADRALGATVLVYCAAISLFVFRADLAQSTQLLWLARAIWTVASILSLGIIAAIFLSRTSAGKLSWLERGWWALDNQVPKKFERVRGFALKAVQALLMYRSRLDAIGYSILACVAALFITITLTAFQAQLLGIPVEPARYTYIVPLLGLAGYFAFLPLGLGVGQVLFFQIFNWMHVPHPELAATLCTLMQIYSLLNSLAGGLAFLSERRIAAPAASHKDWRRAS